MEENKLVDQQIQILSHAPCHTFIYMSECIQLFKDAGSSVWSIKANRVQIHCNRRLWLARSLSSASYQSVEDQGLFAFPSSLRAFLSGEREGAGRSSWFSPLAQLTLRCSGPSALPSTFSPVLQPAVTDQRQKLGHCVERSPALPNPHKWKSTTGKRCKLSVC